MEDQFDYETFGHKVMRLLDEAKRELPPEPSGDDGLREVGCPNGSCLVDPKAADGYEVVSAYLNRTVDELRAEVKAEKELNRKLWVVIAHLRQATGIGWGVIESGHPAWDGFNDKCRTANKLLDGIVPLAPAGGENAG